MSILKILSRNLNRGSRTRRPADRVPYPDGYRGMLLNDPALCVGCKTCAYVCSPGAITFDDNDESCIVWQYFAEQCTFCGRCAEYCPCKALTFDQAAAVVAVDPAQHRVAHQIPYRLCPRCGRPVMPVPATVLAHFYDPAELNAGTPLRLLCEHCRNKVFGQRVKDALRGQADDGSANQNWQELHPVRHVLPSDDRAEDADAVQGGSQRGDAAPDGSMPALPAPGSGPETGDSEARADAGDG
jgi:hydrogenase-4 component H